MNLAAALREPRQVFYLTAFLSSFAFAVVFTVSMVFQVQTAGLSPLQLVLVGTALELSAFLFEIPTGVVADVYSRRISVIIGFFITGIAFLIQAVPLFPAILFGSALWGLGYTFTSGAHQAWITDEVGADQVGPVYLRAGQFGRAGGLIGIPISIALAGYGLAVPIAVGGLLFLLLAQYLIAFMGETGFEPVPAEERETWTDMRTTFQEGLALIRRRPTLLDFMLIGLFVGLYSEGYDRLWTAHLIDNFTFPDLFGLDPVAWFGVIRAVVAVLGIAGNELVRRRLKLEDMGRSVRMLQALYLLMIASLVTFAQTTTFSVALVFLIAFDVARGLTFPIQDTWTNQFIDSKVRATVLSMHSQVDALGQFTGGPFLGWVGNSAGVRTAMTAAAGILLPVLPLYRRTLQRARLRDAADGLA